MEQRWTMAAGIASIILIIGLHGWVAFRSLQPAASQKKISQTEQPANYTTLKN